MQEELQNQIIFILEQLDVADIKPEIYIPTDLSHGDYTTNVALIAASELGKSPHELAEEIKSKFKDQNFKKIEVAGPGFINFWLSEKALLEEIQNPQSGKMFFGQKIMVEFTDPNPFKEFHIGHLYSNIVGESISRLLETQGAEVRRVTYQGDVGLHVAKAIWGMQELMKLGNISIEDLEQKPLTDRIAFLGKAYAHGASSYEDLTIAQDQIKELNKKIFGEDSSIKILYQKGKEWSLAYFETIYRRLGSEFDKNYFESEAGPIGISIVKKHLEDGIFKESDGAIIFAKEKSGLHTRVFINSQGLPTYEAKELGLAPTKYKDFPYDVSIIITGNEINEYFRVLIKALSLINPELAAKTKHISHGMVRLPEGKMSSRSGNIILGEWLIDEVKSQIQHTYPEMNQEVSEQVALGAVKYAFLKQSIGNNIQFDFNQSISFDGNSGPYLQYTYARTQSILKKANLSYPPAGTVSYIPKKEEELLLRKLYQFSQVVKESGVKYSPHLLSTYLFELSQLFSSFYEKFQVLHAGTEEQMQFRLLLVSFVGQTLKNGLDLLGITAPERM